MAVAGNISSDAKYKYCYKNWGSNTVLEDDKNQLSFSVVKALFVTILQKI